MSTTTFCASPLRIFQISAAASPDAAMLTCAAAATRNDDGSCGSSPVSVTAPSAAGPPPVDVQTSERISRGLCIRLTLASLFEHDLFGKPLHTFPDHALLLRRHCLTTEGVAMASIDPLTAGGVLLATALTDAVYVMFTSAVVARRRVPGATWSSIWYVLSSSAVISYAEIWVYVDFAALGSWMGGYRTNSFLLHPPGGPPVGAAVE